MPKKIIFIALLIAQTHLLNAQLPQHVVEEDAAAAAHEKKKTEKIFAFCFAKHAKQHVDLGPCHATDTETQQLFGSIFVALEALTLQNERVLKTLSIGSHQAQSAGSGTAAGASAACTKPQKVSLDKATVSIIDRAKQSLSINEHYGDNDEELQQLAGALHIQIEALKQQQEAIIDLLGNQKKNDTSSATAANYRSLRVHVPHSAHSACTPLQETAAANK